MTGVIPANRSGLIGVGYEGRTVDDLVAHLVAARVSRVVDVRLTPISRKPGLSKTALGATLAGAGIEYEHRRALGNPRQNRAGFAGPPTALAEARAVFSALLRSPESVEALDALAEAAHRQRVAVLCFEADESRCHRDIVLREVHQRAISVSGSRRPAR